jgi:hypothetical protein
MRTKTAPAEIPRVPIIRLAEQPTRPRPSAPWHRVTSHPGSSLERDHHAGRRQRLTQPRPATAVRVQAPRSASATHLLNTASRHRTRHGGRGAGSRWLCQPEVAPEFSLGVAPPAAGWRPVALLGSGPTRCWGSCSRRVRLAAVRASVAIWRTCSIQGSV